jgi:hypothetical protein
MVHVAPGDMVLVSIGADIDFDEYQSIYNKLNETMPMAKVMLMPEYAVKDITVFKTEANKSSNMFLDGGYYNNGY